MLKQGYPAYTTSCAWLGYSDEKLREVPSKTSPITACWGLNRERIVDNIQMALICSSAQTR